MATLWAFNWGRIQRFPQQERLASGKEIRDPRTENSYSEFTKETADTGSPRSLNVLVIVHSLSGETESIVEAFVKGLIKGSSDNCSVRYAPLQVDPPFTFPWSFWSFFDVMPETVFPSLNNHCGTRKVKLPQDSLSNETFDLIILGWQTWFLSPSLPVRLALRTPEWQELLLCNSSIAQGVAPPPVLIVGTHRNMWHLASHTLCTELGAVIGAQRIAGRIDFVQESPFLKSVVDTVRWQLGGEKGSCGVKENAMGRAFDYGVFYSSRLRNSKDSSLVSRSASTMGIVEHDCWFQAGVERRVAIEGLEKIWWPVKVAFSAVMGIFPKKSVIRKMLTCIYVPFLLSTIVFVGAPIIMICSIIEAVMRKVCLRPTKSSY